jgi:hypothetical protein
LRVLSGREGKVRLQTRGASELRQVIRGSRRDNLFVGADPSAVSPSCR